MIPRRSPFPWCRSLAAVLLGSVAAWTAPATAQTTPSPYVFFLFDTSGSMNYSPPCTSAQITAGDCSFLCPTGDCFVPMQGDDPASKFYQLKEGLYTSIAGRDDLLLGFASLNQDALFVRAKHWLYQATSNGPLIPGGPNFPASGAREVFGLAWTCDTGNNDNEIGCYSNKPAHLDVAWDLARVRRLSKGGLLFNQTTDVYLRSAAGIIYRARYTPTGTASPGASTITTTVNVVKCGNTACTLTTVIGTQTITWQLMSDFASWDNADPSNPSRTDPMTTYFAYAAATDASAVSTCNGWDPNTDATADHYNAYSLRWPTDSSNWRGTFFTVGDVLPLDWNNAHKLDVVQRLAPNLVLNPTATPDFRIATYLNDNRLGAEAFLRLKNESSRPLIAVGATPLGGSLASFRTWYSGCSTSGPCGALGGWAAVATAQDPDWASRHTSVVVLTDGDDTCGGDPCAQANILYSLYGVRTFIVAFGMQPDPGSAIECAAFSGGTGSPYYPQTKQELIDDLNLIYTAAANP